MTALPVITHEDYSVHGGKGVWDVAQASLPVAVAAVRDIIGFNVPADEEQVEAYKRAVVAAMQVDMGYGQTGGVGESITSMRIGSFSMTGGGANAYDSDMEKAIRRELAGSGLLYQGLGGI